MWTLVTAGLFIQSGTMTANAVNDGDTFTIPTGDFDLSIRLQQPDVRSR